MLPADIADALQTALACRIARDARAVTGGSIHDAWRVQTSAGLLFVKCGPRPVAEPFDAECEGLRELARANAIRTPAVIAGGTTSLHAYAAFEWIELGSADAAGDARLGAALAQLHRATAPRFGWHRDNFIGATPQRNAWCDDWVAFWQHARLGYQLILARDNGADVRLLEEGERLIELVPAFFAGHTPSPSLIHGDLWSGNRGMDPDGVPVIFDPAVYYADREAELAMTHLFGGFGRSFYQAYEREWPLAAGAEVRCTLYQLYHVLNHFNLFGGSYHAQAAAMISRLLAEGRA